MLKTETYLEKSFELWPGLLRFVASGDGAHAALDAGMDAARDMAGMLMADAELVAEACGSVDFLPRGLAGRQVLDAVRSLARAVGGTKSDDLPPSLVGLPGAVCDIALNAIRSVGANDFVLAMLGDALAFHVESEASLAAGNSVPSVSGEFLRALGDGQAGGVAIAGAQAHFPTSGIADRVVVQAKSAALASLAAAHVADGITAPGMRRRKGRIADPLVARAVEGRTLVDDVGLLPPDEIWDALSAGVRRANALRENRLLRAAALGLKGRGRTLGPVDGDRLLRFGVSEWR